jgi:hypothetical protein
MSVPLYTYAIYWNPSDHPGKFVVRRFESTAGKVRASNVATIHETIDGARLSLPLGLACLQRSPNDDPVIVETWL